MLSSKESPNQRLRKITDLLPGQQGEENRIINRLDHLKISTRRLVEEKAVLRQSIEQLQLEKQDLLENIERKNDVSNLGIIFDLLRHTDQGRRIILKKLRELNRHPIQENNHSAQHLHPSDQEVL